MKKEIDVNKEELIAFGKKMRSIRESLGLNQKTFAAGLGFADSYLCQIEKGKANPTYEFFYKLTSRYRISLDYLFYGKGEMIYGSEKESEGLAELKSNVDNIDKLVWVSEHSGIFRMSILASAHRIIITDGEYIKKEIKQELEKKQVAQKDEED